MCSVFTMTFDINWWNNICTIGTLNETELKKGRCNSNILSLKYRYNIIGNQNWIQTQCDANVCTIE